MKKIRDLLRKLSGQHPKPASSLKEDPAEALSDERVLGGSRRR
jgi:hypothetical protein